MDAATAWRIAELQQKNAGMSGHTVILDADSMSSSDLLKLTNAEMSAAGFVTSWLGMGFVARCKLIVVAGRDGDVVVVKSRGGE